MAATLTLTKSNVCVYSGPVKFSSNERVIDCLRDLDSKRKTSKKALYLYMDSPGGSIYAGLKFIEAVKTIKNLHTVSDFAASMASAIVEALPGRRYGMSTSIMMFHRAKGSFSGQFEDGEVESQLRLWKAIVRHMESINAKRIGISLGLYKHRVKDEWWVFGKDNVTKGILDEIVTIKCSPSRFMGQVDYEFCPL